MKLGDVANIFISYKNPTSFRRINGEDAITFAVLREPGANVVKTMELLNKEIESLNKTNLNNKGLELYNVYDETVYINNAIDLVSGIKIEDDKFISETLVTHKSSSLKKVIKLKQNIQ